MTRDLVARQLDGQRTDHGADAALARAIVAGARRALDRRGGGHRHQRAALAALDHVLGGCTEGEEHAVEIDPRDPAPFLVIHLEDRALAAARDAGIGDAVVDMAHDLDGLGEGIDDLLLLADIDELGMDLAAVALELLARRVGLLLAGAPDADIGAGLGHRVGHAEADAAIAAGHQRHLARQIEALVGHVHSSPFIFLSPARGEDRRGGRGGDVRRPLTQHLPLAGERRMNRKSLPSRSVQPRMIRFADHALSVSTSTISASSLARSVISASSTTATPSRALAVTGLPSAPSTSILPLAGTR